MRATVDAAPEAWRRIIRAMVRTTVYYSGRVQGVGFRATAQHVARGFGVAGQVRNLDDGRVELLAEGEPAEVRRFLDAVAESMGQYIRSAAEHQSPATGEFDGFKLSY